MEPVHALTFGDALRGAESHPVTPSTLGARVVGVLGPPVVAVATQGGGTQRIVHLEPVVVRAEAIQRAWVALLSAWGDSVGYHGG